MTSRAIVPLCNAKTLNKAVRLSINLCSLVSKWNNLASLRRSIIIKATKVGNYMMINMSSTRVFKCQDPKHLKKLCNCQEFNLKKELTRLDQRVKAFKSLRGQV